MKFVKYIVGGVCGLILFWLSWSLQFIWWFPEEALGYAIGSMAQGAMDMVKSARHQHLQSAPEILSAAGLEDALRKNDWEENPLFYAAYKTPDGGETIYVTVDTGWESPGKMTAAQRKAFQTFIDNYASSRKSVIETALVEYLQYRDKMEAELTKDSTRTRATTFGPVVLPAKLTPADLAPGKCLTMLSISGEEKNGTAYSVLSFEAPNNMLSQVQCYMHGTTQLTEKEYRKAIYGDNPFFDYDEEEDGDEEDFGDGGRQETMDRINSIRSRR